MPTVTNYATGDDTTRGNVAWTNPGNVSADDGVYATRSGARRTNSDEYWLIPAFSIPNGSTVNSVLCEVRWKGSANNATARTFQFYVGTTAKTPALTGTSNPTADTTQSWSPTGVTLAELQGSDLAVLTRFNPDSNATTYTIDFVRVTADYTEPVGSTTGTLSGTVPAVSGSVSGESVAASTTGAVSGSVPRATFSGSGSSLTTGVLAASSGLVAASIPGSLVVTGALAASTSSVSGSFPGVSLTVGS